MTRAEAPSRLRLIAITDFSAIRPDVALERWERLACAAAPGTAALDLRDRSLPARRLLELGARFRDAARAAEQAFIVNDRLDLAALLEADGVHLGEESVGTADARRFLPDAFVVRACHAPDAVAGLDAEIALLSPILAPRKGNPALGLAALGRARSVLEASSGRARLFALGGVDAAGAGACIRSGADGVAAIGAALGAEDAEGLIAALGIRR